jgi:hypothetical protein
MIRHHLGALDLGDDQRRRLRLLRRDSRSTGLLDIVRRLETKDTAT